MEQFPTVQLFKTMPSLIEAIEKEAKANDHVLFMSNGGFGGIHQLVEDRLGE